MPVYLVERYWPGVTLERLREALEEARHVLADMRLEVISVWPISFTPIPSEEVRFSAYQGPSAEAVRFHNERVGLPFSKIVEAIAVMGDEKMPVGDGG